MTGRTLVYRGGLKSCNYQCSYCPFSKHPMSERELSGDREQWLRFVENLIQRKGAGAEALLVAPYGEAMIHPWYLKGLALVSALPAIRAAGAQTNLSFPVRKSLENIFDRAGGIREKLRFWATFHPKMTDAEKFSGQCGELLRMGVQVSAGAVGVPEHLEVLRELRRRLPKEIYLWINKMDGLGRQYTEEEREDFLDIDPYFLRELACPPADAKECAGRLFAEGDGRLRTCNISRVQEGRWEQRQELLEYPPSPVCGRKLCSCYLAYGGRDNDMNRILFGPYPLFRIPRRAKAVFFDLAGTLISGEGKITDMTLAGLTGLVRDGIPVFAATTLSCGEARRRCFRFRELFSGGIFLGGAHLIWHGGQERKEIFYDIAETCLAAMRASASELRCRVLAYREKGHLCKITLLRPGRMPWSGEEREYVSRLCDETAPGELRCFTEGNCLEITAKKADKAGGVRTLCGWLGIRPGEAAAAGDSKEGEDKEMLEICGGCES